MRKVAYILLVFIPFVLIFAQEDDWNIMREFIGVGMDPSGMFSVGIPQDGEEPIELLSGDIRFGGGTSRNNFFIDGTFYTNDEGAAAFLGITDLNTGYSTESGKTLDGNSFKTFWEVGDIQFFQRLTPIDIPEDSSGVVVMYYVFYNNGSVDHEIGMLSLLDTKIRRNDASPIRDDLGALYDTSSVFEGEDAIPEFWETHGLLADTALTAMCDIGAPLFSAPDRMAICDDRAALSILWDWREIMSLGEDLDAGTAVIMWYEPVTLGPGESMIISYSYGTSGGVSSGGRIDVTYTRPRWANIIECELVPETFPMRLIVQNATPFAMDSVWGHIELDSGLELVEGDPDVLLRERMSAGSRVPYNWVIDVTDPPLDETGYPYTMKFFSITESLYVHTDDPEIVDTFRVPDSTIINDTIWVPGSEYRGPDWELAAPLSGLFTSDPMQPIKIYMNDPDAGVDISTVECGFIPTMRDTNWGIPDSTIFLEGDTCYVYPFVPYVDGAIVSWLFEGVSDYHGCAIPETSLVDYFRVDLSGPELGDFWPPLDTLVHDSLIIPWIIVEDRIGEVDPFSTDITIDDDEGVWDYNGHDFPDMVEHTPGDTLKLELEPIPARFPDGDVVLTLNDITDWIDYGEPNSSPDCPFNWEFEVNAHGPRVGSRVPANGWYTSNPDQSTIFWVYDGNDVNIETIIFDVDGITLDYTDGSFEHDSIFTYPAPGVWESGYVVECEVTECEDIYGTPLDTRSETSWSYTIDLDPPIVTAASFMDGDVYGSTDLVLSIEVEDELAGICYHEVEISVNHDTYDISHASLSWSGDELTWDMSLSDYIPEPAESTVICVTLSDSVHVGEHNTETYCSSLYFDPSGPVVNVINDFLCGASDSIMVEFIDLLAIDETSIVITVDGTELSLPSDYLVFNEEEQMLTIRPMTTYAEGDEVEVCFTSLANIDGNPCSSLPHCFTLVADVDMPSDITLESHSEYGAPYFTDDLIDITWIVTDFGGIDDETVVINVGSSEYTSDDPYISVEENMINFDATGAGLVFDDIDSVEISMSYYSVCGILVEADPVIMIQDIEETRIELPNGIVLNQNTPNPFNTSTLISFEIPENMNAKLEIADIRGCVIRTLFNGNAEAGLHEFTWDGRNDSGLMQPSGFYLYRIVTQNEIHGKGMFLLK